MAYAPVNRTQIITCLIGTVDACKLQAQSVGTDFARDSVTATLLQLHMAGTVVLLCALTIGFTHSTKLPFLGLVAAVLSLPTYLYVLAPGPFRQMVPAEYNVPLTANVSFDIGAMVGIVTCVMLACLYMNSLMPPKTVTVYRAWTTD